jgi:tRNA(fMet)-specific endonuclease VapC
VILLDTCIVIDILRDRPHPDLPALAQPAVAAITVAELHQGALRGEHAGRRLSAVDAFLDVVTVLDYTRATATEHAALLAYTSAIGQPRGAHDLIIAAHARQTGARLITSDGRARFEHLPGVAARTLP